MSAGRTPRRSPACGLPGCCGCSCGCAGCILRGRSLLKSDEGDGSSKAARPAGRARMPGTDTLGEVAVGRGLRGARARLLCFRLSAGSASSDAGDVARRAEPVSAAPVSAAQGSADRASGLGAVSAGGVP
eukprot:CAMPEP_0179840174 /NCGR_PEP_ID=MMETSP0982-20121206/1772_1 /TAXON_ID=483367 /ORGANISM="non described non described, Strain CCMP 2436" /LENGTH=129 /DNA_ID=CAMNT_0021724001 /DNA_START=238 /DNA_END=627 /DNA_ORIENTATION=+